jgi:hypothetical protein
MPLLGDGDGFNLNLDGQDGIQSRQFRNLHRIQEAQAVPRSVTCPGFGC